MATDNKTLQLREALYLRKDGGILKAGENESGIYNNLRLRKLLSQQNHQAVLSELDELSSTRTLTQDQLYTSYYANYLKSFEELDSTALGEWVTKIEEAELSNQGMLSPHQTLIQASVYYYEERYEDALKLLESHPRHLECNALSIQIYLKTNRLELAQQCLDAMKAYADDDMVCQLAECWVNLFSYGGRYQTCFYTLEELGGNSPSDAILNAQAICHLAQGNTTDAEQLLQEALNKKTKAETSNLQINLGISQRITTKSTTAEEVVNVKVIQESSPLHPYVAYHDALEAKFDQAAERFKKKMTVQ